MSTVLEDFQNALALPLRKLRPVSSKNSSEKNPHSCLLEIDYMHKEMKIYLIVKIFSPIVKPMPESPSSSGTEVARRLLSVSSLN